jgi:hypothetical protein
MLLAASVPARAQEIGTAGAPQVEAATGGLQTAPLAPAALIGDGIASPAMTAAPNGAQIAVDVAAGLADDPGAGVTSPDLPQHVKAVWVERKINFTYFAGQTFYSCNGFRDKLRYILLKLGALPQTLKIVSNCSDSMGIQPMSGARITLAMPVEVTPELLAKIEADAPRRELVRRVRGEQPIDVQAAQFPAAWKAVDFSGRRDRRVMAGDCELLRQMAGTLFQHIGVRFGEDSMLRCTQGPLSLGAIRFKAETLQPLQQAERPAYSSTKTT